MSILIFNSYTERLLESDRRIVASARKKPSTTDLIYRKTIILFPFSLDKTDLV